MTSIRTILHPTDFSESSEHAFRLACSLRATTLRASSSCTRRSLRWWWAAKGSWFCPANFELEPLREQLEAIQPDGEPIPGEHRLVEGDPVIEILAMAAESNCDLIVMGTHGRTGLRRLLMGSVAEQVMRKRPVQC